MFMENLEKTWDEEYNTSVTENGAIGYKTTGKELLDLNFSVSSMRNMSENEIMDRFLIAYFEDEKLAIKWLFHVRDIREGQGERRLFRVCVKALTDLGENSQKIIKSLLSLIPEYGRWDDLFALWETDLWGDVCTLIKDQLQEDMENEKKGEPISLLAKWLPSVTTNKYKEICINIRRRLGMSAKEYRQTLSRLRKYLDVTEVKMSANDWNKIKYETVPSRANLIYSDAFLRHDEERRREYLSSLKRGETKINAGVLYPSDIVYKYMSTTNTHGFKEDDTLEELWKALPDYVQGESSTICVADGSGSMTMRIENTGMSALDVANGLTIYFAERCEGEFKNKYITFSDHPQLVDLRDGSLLSKILIAWKHDEIASTNIEAVFNLILKTAIKGKMKQEEIPHNILILSDMEFNMATDGIYYGYNNYDMDMMHTPPKRLFKGIEEKFLQAGYKLPRLIFWNIGGRTDTIPLKENSLGVTLVSGFSPTIMKMVLSNELDPWKCLLGVLNGERYKPIDEALKGIIK